MGQSTVRRSPPPCEGHLQDQNRGQYGVVMSVDECHDPSTAIELSLYPH